MDALYLLILVALYVVTHGLVLAMSRLGDTRGLRSYIKTLRQKLEPDPGRPRYLVTEAGIG